jgi:predicted nucleic acid-binding protein
MSARNMGKNDLWIAASAMIAQGTLITTDKDFNHLHETLIKVDYIDIKEFQ